jgi:drug/metabolite transporter (DMT)-like permease
MAIVQAPTQPSTAAAVLRVVVAGACWGLSAVIAKSGFDRGVPPVRMASARVVVALVVLAAILAYGRRDLMGPPRAALPALLGFGLCVAGVNAAYYIALDRVPVGVAISLQYTGPVLLLGLAAVTAVRKPGRLAWVAAVLSVGGAVLVSQAHAGLSRLDGIGLAAGLASAGLFAGYLLTAELAGRRGAEPATVLFWGFVVATAFWSVAAPWWSWPVDRLADPSVVLSVLGVGLVGTLIPFFLSVGAVRVLTPATAGIAATVEPPAAAFFALVFLGQTLTAVQVMGGVLILGAVAVAQRSAAVREQTLAVEVAS